MTWRLADAVDVKEDMILSAWCFVRMMLSVGGLGCCHDVLMGFSGVREVRRRLA